MFKFGSAFFVLTAAVMVATQTPAQQKPRASPHETVSAVLAGNRVTITYGRPLSKDRKIWGGLVPWGKAWRTGADEATTLLTQQPLKIGDTEVPAGLYTLYTVPMEKGPSKLAISKKNGGWGIPVDEKNDLARVDLTTKTLDKKVDQFTIAIAAEKGSPTGTLKMSWENTELSVPITTVKK